jgi:Sec7-like guanine-nucleotide exchange factor
MSSPYSNDFSRMVAAEYLSFFDFTGLAVDMALRYVLVGYAAVRH